MKRPAVSVIVCTYNQEESIGATLESILAQECDFDFEIIIGEDGSGDGTRAICERYAREFPEAVRLMPATANKGLVDNYFDCLEAARGEYVCDCAGDDMYPARGRLQKQYEYMQTHRDKVCVMSDWVTEEDGTERYSAEDERYAPFHTEVDGERMLALVLGARDSFPMLSAMMFRRECLMEVMREAPRMVRRTDWRCEDVPVVAALASKGGFGYLRYPASAYRVSGGSVSNTRDPERLSRFYSGVAHAVATLITHYGVMRNTENGKEQRELRGALDERISYLAWLHWRSPSKEGLKGMVELARIWPCTIPAKVKIRMMLMRLKLYLS